MNRIDIAARGRRFHFDAPAGEKVLFAGLRAGIPLPHECATGTCGSCRGRLKSGQIDAGWLQAPGRKRFKPGGGELLMCQAVAQSPCRLAVASDMQPFRKDDLRPAHYRGTIAGCAKLTADVLRFDVTLSAPARFHAGQFFVLRAPTVNGYRAYSMVNYRAPAERLEFIIKRKPHGAFSNWLFDADQTGASIDLFGPLGRATFHQDESCDLFMIAGGSGIAGLLSILEHACSAGYLRDHKAALFFGVRTWDDVFFVDRLASMRQRAGRHLTVHITVSEQNPAQPRPENLSAFSTSHGLVHQAALKALPADAADTMVYVAGPPPMVDASLAALIAEARVAPRMIRYDKFT